MNVKQFLQLPFVQLKINNTMQKRIYVKIVLHINILMEYQCAMTVSN